MFNIILGHIKLGATAIIWLLYAPFMVVLVLASYGLSFALALPCFVRHNGVAHESEPRFNRDRLVSWLAWFQTFDNPVDEAYWGGYGLGKWVDYFHLYYPHKTWLGAVSRYMYRLYWLWRNPVYGFARWPFGANCASWAMAYEKNGNWLAVSNDAGWLRPFALRTENWHGWRLYLGWKITRNERDGLPRKMYTMQFKRAKS